MALSFVCPYSWVNLVAKLSAFLQLHHLRGSWRLKKLVQRQCANRYIQVSYLNLGSVWVCPDQPMGREIFWNGVYEPNVAALIHEYIGHRFSFVDVGANQGFHSIVAAKSR